MTPQLLKKLWKQRFGSAPNKTFLEFFCGLWPFYEPDYRDFLYAWEVSTIVWPRFTSENQRAGFVALLLWDARQTGQHVYAEVPSDLIIRAANLQLEFNQNGGA